MIKRKQNQYSAQSSQSGFTIVESLMAIVVVAILMTSIAPVIVLSAATRVQAKRVELATQTARAYIDGLRAGGTVIHPGWIATGTLNDFAAPAPSLPSCSANSYCSGSQNLYCIDGDSSGYCTSNNSKDLVIQAFRNSQFANDGYGLGLRLYRADAFDGNGALKKNLVNQKVTQATFTGGLGERKAPLVEMTTEIFVNNKTTYRDFCDRLDGVGTNGVAINSCE